jgi:hypothetical protein
MVTDQDLPSGEDEDAPAGFSAPAPRQPVEHTPTEVEDFIAQLGDPHTNKLRQVVKSANLGEERCILYTSSSVKNRPVLTPDEIGERFGPGRREIALAWYEGKTSKIKGFYVTYGGPHYAEAHRQYTEQVASRSKPAPGPALPSYDPVAGLKEGLALAKGLVGNQNSGMDLMLPLITMMMQNSQQSADRQMQMMMEQSRQNIAMMTSLVSAMSNRPVPQVMPQPAPDEQFAKMLGFTERVMQMKNMIAPEAKGAVDRVLDILSDNIGPVMAILSQPKVVRQPVVTAVKANMLRDEQMKADWDTLMQNPEVLNELAQRSAKKWGKDQTNLILDSLGLPKAFAEEVPAPQPRPSQAVEAEIVAEAEAVGDPFSDDEEEGSDGEE